MPKPKETKKLHPPHPVTKKDNSSVTKTTSVANRTGGNHSNHGNNANNSGKLRYVDVVRNKGPRSGRRTPQHADSPREGEESHEKAQREGVESQGKPAGVEKEASTSTDIPHGARIITPSRPVSRSDVHHHQPSTATQSRRATQSTAPHHHRDFPSTGTQTTAPAHYSRTYHPRFPPGGKRRRHNLPRNKDTR